MPAGAADRSGGARRSPKRCWELLQTAAEVPAAAPSGAGGLSAVPGAAWECWWRPRPLESPLQPALSQEEAAEQEAPSGEPQPPWAACPSRTQRSARPTQPTSLRKHLAWDSAKRFSHVACFRDLQRCSSPRSWHLLRHQNSSAAWYPAAALQWVPGSTQRQCRTGSGAGLGLSLPHSPLLLLQLHSMKAAGSRGMPPLTLH